MMKSVRMDKFCDTVYCLTIGAAAAGDDGACRSVLTLGGAGGRWAAPVGGAGTSGRRSGWSGVARLRTAGRASEGQPAFFTRATGEMPDARRNGDGSAGAGGIVS